MRRWWPAFGLLAISVVALPRDAGGEQSLTGALPQGELGLRSQLKRINQRVLELDRLVEMRGRAYVRLVRLGVLPMSQGFDGFVSHAQRAELMRRSLIKDLKERLQLIRRQAQLNELLAESGGRALSTISVDRRSQDAILAAEEREAAFRQAFGEPSESAQHTTVFGSFEGMAEAKRFDDLKGKLTFPVEGRARVADWEPEGRGPGLRFEVGPNTLPRAVYRGKVVMVGDYGELGQAVVIDHGHGYSTVTANLEETFVEAGVRVKAGAALGKLKSEHADSALYFELRHQGFAVAPAEWFGL